LKELELLESKSNLNNGTSGGLAYRFGQVGYNERKLKDLEINEQPHNNGTSGGLAYRFGQGGCKRKCKKINLILAFTILQGWLRPISLQGVGNIF
jgi:hypothetical protein